MYFKEYRKQWLQIAESLKPKLNRIEISPLVTVSPEHDVRAFQNWRMIPQQTISEFYSRCLKQGESATLDFGGYVVGYLQFDIAMVGTMDAPVRLKLTFGESPAEVAEPFEPYSGHLSRAWLQDETINLDILPQTVNLPRRYAFRYLKIEVLGASPQSELRFSNIHCATVTSAEFRDVPKLSGVLSEVAHSLDHVSLTTLASCMQTVFEDGPKRDRRLWIGDLRLQALTNYVSFGNTDLVKRCLYLFAAFAHDNGLVPACVFETPEPHRGQSDILDYVALYVPTLLEYAQASGDWKTARNLWPLARRQLESLLEYVDADGLFIDPGTWWIFIDWQEDLHKQTAMHGVIVYCLRRGIELGKKLGCKEQIVPFEAAVERMRLAARRELMDCESGLFTSGPSKQISWASQIWMILSEVISSEEGAQLLNELSQKPDSIQPAGPYLYHYVIEAMLHCGLNEEARTLLGSYWGGMLNQGATAFWEVYDPQNDFLSPYNNHLINSYCHAWSCTPAYFIRRYPKLFSDSSRKTVKLEPFVIAH